jgi:hypothetical protein
VRTKLSLLFASILSVASLAGAAAAVPAQAATSAARPSFVPWKVGTPLPKVPSGYKLMAWPPSQVMSHIKVGQKVPWVAVVIRETRAAARTYRSLENSAGFVNLELVPEPRDCVPSLPQFKKNEGSHAATVMQSYSTIRGVTQSFSYGNGQSSSLGVGVSQSGAAGSFTASGTVSQSTDATQAFNPQHGRSFNHFQTYFEWGKYYIGNSCPQLDGYETMVYQWNAGTHYVHPRGAPRATFCTPEHRGDKFTQSNTKATTLSAGFTVTPLKFTGSAQTGYSATASIEFEYTHHAPRNDKLCGEKNTPPNKPGVLVAS